MILVLLLQGREEKRRIFLVQEHAHELGIFITFVLLAQFKQLLQILLLSGLGQQQRRAANTRQLIHGSDTVVNVDVISFIEQVKLSLLDDLDDGGNVLSGQLEGETQRGRQTGKLQAFVDEAPGLEDVGDGIVLVLLDLLGPVEGDVDLTGGNQHDKANGGVGEREGDDGARGGGHEKGAFVGGEQSAAAGGESGYGREKRVGGGVVDDLVGVDGGLQGGESGQGGAMAEAVGGGGFLVDDHEKESGGGEQEEVVANQVAGDDGVVHNCD